MKLHELTYSEGSRHSRKRLGRGTATGQGKTAGRGDNGQNSRSGGGVRLGFEGGQNPLYRRLPKRGFTNGRFKKDFEIVNIEQLNAYTDNETVNVKSLYEKKIIKTKNKKIKILGNGTLTKTLTFDVAKISKSAQEQILKNKGTL